MVKGAQLLCTVRLLVQVPEGPSCVPAVPRPHAGAGKVKGWFVSGRARIGGRK